MTLCVRSKSPLRLGIAGGGTDVSPYSDLFGGCVLNATIDMFAHCTLEVLDNGMTEFIAADRNERFEAKSVYHYPLEGNLILHKAVYNRIVKNFAKQPLSIRLTTFSDAPAGSGLGSSSTLVVGMVTAFQELLKLPLGEYDIAHLAYEIERIDCGLAGGKQDQYAATFGGFNFMEFYANDKVIVNPLRIRENILNELQAHLLLYFTGVSRDSADIIKKQIKSVTTKDESHTNSMHEVKRLSYLMKEKLLSADIEGMASLIHDSWEAKKHMAEGISNSFIDNIEKEALAGGAKALKISGAGGGGFIMIFVDPKDKVKLIEKLSSLGGQFFRFQFTESRATSWKVA